MQPNPHRNIPPIMPPYTTKPSEPSVLRGLLMKDFHSTIQNKTLAQAKPPKTAMKVSVYNSSGSIFLLLASFVAAMNAAIIPRAIISPYP